MTTTTTKTTTTIATTTTTLTTTTPNPTTTTTQTTTTLPPTTTTPTSTTPAGPSGIVLLHKLSIASNLFIKSKSYPSKVSSKFKLYISYQMKYLNIS